MKHLSILFIFASLFFVSCAVHTIEINADEEGFDIFVKSNFSGYNFTNTTDPIICDFGKYNGVCLDDPTGKTCSEGEDPFSILFQTLTYDDAVIAVDYCHNSTVLIETHCGFNYDAERYNVISYNVTCPDGCFDGACKAPVEETCIDGVCYDKSLSCDDTWRDNNLPLFVESGWKLSFGEPGQSESFYRVNTCNDNKMSIVTCTAFTEDYYADFYSQPTVSSLDCPQGFSCVGNVCGQDEFEIDLDSNSDLQVDASDLVYSLANKIDINQDGSFDGFDTYFFNWWIGEDRVLKPYEFNLTSDDYVRTREESKGTLELTYPGARTWAVEHEWKGNSRSRCDFPSLKFNLKDVSKSERLLGYSEESGELRYDEFKLIPLCDIWEQYPVDNLLREYIIYSLFRREGVRTLDVIGFANVAIESPDVNIDDGIYLVRQVATGQKDEIPFKNQFGYQSVLDDSDVRGEWSQTDRITQYAYSDISIDDPTPDIVVVNLDIETSLKYHILIDFVSLGDRSTFWNEDLAIRNDGVGEIVAYDFDISFDCLSANRLPGLIRNVPNDERDVYYQKAYDLAQEFYGNETNLYEALADVYKFPYPSNSKLMVVELKKRFANGVLEYNSQSTADDFSVERQSMPNVEWAEDLLESIDGLLDMCNLN